MPNDELLALDRQVCFALAAASRAVIGMYRPVLEPLGITHPQYLVLLALWEKEPRTLSELSELLLLDSATLSPLVKRLERAELIVRARATHDERSLAIELTEKGRALREKALDVPPHIVDKLGLPVEELERTRDSLHRLLRAATNNERPE